MPPNNDIFNPNENLHIPSWINADYFRDIVAKDVPDMVAISEFTPTAATPPGKNFTSIMLRIHMDLEMKDGSTRYKTYIFKTMLDEDTDGEMTNKLPLFPKEMKMYDTYLPAFVKMYKDAGWNIQMAPKCLYTKKTHNRINFVFEDLSERKFKNLDRLEGFDMSHMQRTLRKLAEFHAASAVYEEINGAYPAEFQFRVADTRQRPQFFKQMFDLNAITYKKAMTQWGLEKGDEYIKKFPTSEQYWKSSTACLQQSYNSFNVLTHGDFWSGNIMFNYLKSGEVHETLMIDFQTCKWGSPVEDLLFFITLSPSTDIRLTEYDHFVAIYHERLVECLKVLGYRKPLPTLRGLHQDMYDKKFSFYPFFACTNHLPLLTLPADEDNNLANFCRADEIGESLRMKAYTTPRFVAIIKDIFTFYHQRGVFNFEDYD